MECVVSEVVNHLMDRVSSDSAQMIMDISIEAAHNISEIIKYIAQFEILSNDLEYMTRNFGKLWKKFVKLGHILDKDMSLSALTMQLNQGELDVFEKSTLKKLICALLTDSEKRKTFIEDIELMLDE